MDKKAIREQMKKQRATLSKESVLEYSSMIWNKIVQMPVFQSSTTVFLYSSMGKEVSTVEIAQVALAKGKTIAYPVTHTKNNTMEFHKIEKLSELVPVKAGSFNILEPSPDPKTKVIPNDLTLMIVPGLAFDKDCYRTGYGGGFYDKYIAAHPVLKTVGVCYDFQLIDQIPINEYDQPVQEIITPRMSCLV